MIETGLLLAGGLILLLAGGEMFVRHSVTLALAFRVSPLLVGLTLVGFGTSTPELLTSASAAIAGSPGIAVGNVVGSNTANILLILGLSALVWPVATPARGFARDIAAVIGSAILLSALLLAGWLTWITGLGMLGLLAAYLMLAYRQERDSPEAAGDLPDASAATTASRIRIGLYALAGLGLVLGGAWMLVEGAIGLARVAGLSEAVIGLTIVAVGTSLPELVVSMVAAFRRQSEVAIGNILGSNIFNVLCIMGATTLVSPGGRVEQGVAVEDLAVMLAASLALLATALTGRRISRAEGLVLLAGYVVYVVWLGTRAAA
ncbi:MAG: calcium/sodium antiporter [Pseudomonadota bacterium]|nr:calcium/sodium antiporter [Pseudomonadota bacterium]